MIRYKTQIGSTEPNKWIVLRAQNVREAAIAALRRVGPSVLPCTVYVGQPHLAHDNGAPMIVHAFDIVRDDKK